MKGLRPGDVTPWWTVIDVPDRPADLPFGGVLLEVRFHEDGGVAFGAGTTRIHGRTYPGNWDCYENHVRGMAHEAWQSQLCEDILGNPPRNVELWVIPVEELVCLRKP